jgi:hypothetical protein
MPNSKSLFCLILASLILFMLILPVLAVDYNSGVSVGQYVKYGNFSGSGEGFESFNDYGFLQLTVVSVIGKNVTLLSTGQFKNGTTLPGNGPTTVWNIEAGTADGNPTTQGPIIAANLNVGDAIPPPDTYSINQTENRGYLGTSRTVNILNVQINTPDYNSTLNYVYDKISGMLLESSTQTTTQSQPQPVSSSYSYSIIATNIFGSNPSPSIPEFSNLTAGITVTIALIGLSVVLLLLKRRK